MIQLITISDFTQYKSLSVNLNTAKKLDPFILEAQQFDLKKILGDAFYLDFIKDFSASPTLSKYYDLWNGSEFSYHNQTVRQEGLKIVLCYLSYARYVLNSNVESTAFGTVNKITPESEHVDDKTAKRLYDQAYAGALDYFEDIKKYLQVQDFPLWQKFIHHKLKTNRISGVSAKDDEYYLRNRRLDRRHWRDEY